MRRANVPQTTQDVGHRLENAVFLELRRRRRQENAAYAGDKDLWECDFVTDSEIIQVCAELNRGNREREMRGMLAALALPGPKRRPIVITMEQRDRITIEGAVVDVRPGSG